MFGTQTDATLLRELEQAQRDRLAAEAANSAKTLFLSRISHETDPAMKPLRAQRQQLKMIRDAGAPLTAPKAIVRADPTRLRQVLSNLLSKAIKYNRPGDRVTLRAHAVDDEWRIAVEDAGHGLSAAEA